MKLIINATCHICKGATVVEDKVRLSQSLCDSVSSLRKNVERALNLHD